MGASKSKPADVPVCPTCPVCKTTPDVIYYRSVYNGADPLRTVKGVNNAAGCIKECKADSGCDAWNHMWGDTCYLLKNNDNMHLIQTDNSWKANWSAGSRNVSMPNETFVGRRSC